MIFKNNKFGKYAPMAAFGVPDEYMVLSGFYKYLDNVTLDLISIISKRNNPILFVEYIFQKETLIQEAGKHWL